MRIACVTALWDWDIVLLFSNGRWEEITLGMNPHLDSLDLSCRLIFDAEISCFDSGLLRATVDSHDLRIEGVARITSTGTGYGLTVEHGQDEFLQRLRLRFNLKRSLNEVAEATHAPRFSYAEAWVRMTPAWATRPVDGWLWLDPPGLVEAGASTYWALFPDQGISAAGTIRLFPSDRRITLTPLWVYEAPECVQIIATVVLGEPPEAAWRLVWHAVGIHADLGEVNVRTLHVVDPSASVIRPPYSDCIRLKWKRHLGERLTSMSLELYFGRTGFFGLGEANLTLAFAPTAALQLDLSADVSPSSLLRFELRWALHL